MAAEGKIDRLVRDLYFPGTRDGVLIEVGAAGPEYLSISAFYRALGWRVIAIEPNPDFCDAHRALGHDVLEYACSDRDADDADFFVVQSRDARYAGGDVTMESFSSLKITGQFANLLDTVKNKAVVSQTKVKVRKLDTILELHAPDLVAIDILAIDVEGWELQVMRGLNFDRHRPKVVILENLFRGREYRKFMADHGYSRRFSLAPNEIYVLPHMISWRVRLRELLAVISNGLFN